MKKRMRWLPILLLISLIGCQQISVDTFKTNLEKHSNGLSYLKSPLHVFSFDQKVESMDWIDFIDAAGFFKVYSVQVNEIPFDEFIKPLAEKDIRWMDLKVFMRTHLDQIKVYKIKGDIPERFYLAGLYRSRIVGIMIVVE